MREKKRETYEEYVQRLGQQEKRNEKNLPEPTLSRPS
jgi:hypothetical protein